MVTDKGFLHIIGKGLEGSHGVVHVKDYTYSMQRDMEESSEMPQPFRHHDYIIDKFPLLPSEGEMACFGFV